MQRTASALRDHLALEQRALSRLATVRMIPPDEGAQGIVVDLLFSSTGIESEICRSAETMALTETLHTADLQALIQVLTPAERKRAAAAVDRIESLGANRGKPLRAELAAILDS